MRRLLVLCIILFTGIQAFSQTQQQGPTCAQTLRLARATYEQGRLQEIELQLKSCLESGFSKDERQLKVEGYKILCLSYIYLEEPEKADEAMLNILKTDPYFQINPAVDPAEFVALYKTFRTEPIYRIGLKIGGNFSRPNVVDFISAVELASGSEFKALFGFQVAASADLPISKRLTLHGDLGITQNRYQITEKVNRGTSLETGETLVSEFVGIETQSRIHFPITAEYTLLNEKSKFGQKYKPYVAAGMSTSYLLSANITSGRERDGESSIPESGIPVERNQINLSAIVATGIKMKVASGLFVAEVRYLYGISEVSSSETAYDNQKLLWEYGYADPVFRLSSFELNFAYVLDIFKPKKLNRKK